MKLEELKDILALDDHQTDQFRLYRDLLTEWNQKMNLTAITDPDEIAEKHF